MTMPDRLTDERLDELERLCAEATPGPWYVRHLDDDVCMNLVAVSTRPDTGRHESWPAFDHGEIVAATLVQSPRYVDVADERWYENAAFIAAARDALPALIAEVRALRKENAALQKRVGEWEDRYSSLLRQHEALLRGATVRVKEDPEFEALRRVAEAAEAVVSAQDKRWRIGLKGEAERNGIERLRSALAEWRRVRGE